MNVVVIGSGYVGLSLAACLSDIGHKVACVDKDTEKIGKIKSGIMPFYEPNMEDMVLKNVGKSLFFTTDLKTVLPNSEVCFIAVGTPSNSNGSVDTTQIYSALDDISKYMKNYTVIVNKSTVPIGQAKKSNEYLKKLTDVEFDIVSNPEFLRQGCAVNDFLYPDRVIIGSSSKKAINIMLELYKPLGIEDRIIITDEESAETAKYASNAFLAVKISYMNELSNLCEKTGADIDKVKLAMGFDKRIGKKFLNAGLGWGGSCFPKDVKGIIDIAKQYNVELNIINSALIANQNQKEKFLAKILNFYNNNIKNKVFCFWGLAFKPDTDDMREAPSIYLINELLSRGAKIQAYDPKAAKKAREVVKDKIKYFDSKEEALKNADTLVIPTEWKEFRAADVAIIAKELKDKTVFDGRNIFDIEEMNKYGLKYYCVGKNGRQK